MRLSATEYAIHFRIEIYRLPLFLITIQSRSSKIFKAGRERFSIKQYGSYSTVYCSVAQLLVTVFMSKNNKGLKRSIRQSVFHATYGSKLNTRKEWFEHLNVFKFKKKIQN